eukprot:2515391-Amphidinium_carterae.1
MSSHPRGPSAAPWSPNGKSSTTAMCTIADPWEPHSLSTRGLPEDIGSEHNLLRSSTTNLTPAQVTPCACTWNDR